MYNQLGPWDPNQLGKWLVKATNLGIPVKFPLGLSQSPLGLLIAITKIHLVVVAGTILTQYRAKVVGCVSVAIVYKKAVDWAEIVFVESPPALESTLRQSRGMICAYLAAPMTTNGA